MSEPKHKAKKVEASISEVETTYYTAFCAECNNCIADLYDEIVNEESRCSVCGVMNIVCNGSRE